MKILLIAQNIEQNSGWGTYAYNTAKGLHERGHTIVMLTNKHREAAYTQEIGLPNALSLMESIFARWMATYAIYKTIKKHEPDIIHILAEPYAMAMPTVRRFIKSPPWLMNFHGTYSALTLAQTNTRKPMCKAMEQMSRCVVCSNYTLEKALRAIAKYCTTELAKIVKEKSILFRLGIDIPKDLKASPKTEVRNILFIGEVKDRKGVRELVNGFAEFKKISNMPLHLDIIGNTSRDVYVQQLKKIIFAHGIEENVTIHGKVSNHNLQKAYEKANIFVMLSRSTDIDFEGFGLVFIEANSKGIPTIGSKDSGCAEAIKDGVSGYVVHAIDARDVAEHLRLILEEDTIKPENCYQWAQEHSVEQQAEQFEKIYNELIN